MKRPLGRPRAHRLNRPGVEEVSPVEVRVVERWVEDEQRAQEARAHLEALIRHAAVRRITERLKTEIAEPA